MEKIEAPLARYGELTWADKQALMDRGRQARSQATHAYARSLFAVIGGLFAPAKERTPEPRLATWA
jgi:hypothetical protein